MRKVLIMAAATAAVSILSACGAAGSSTTAGSSEVAEAPAASGASASEATASPSPTTPTMPASESASATPTASPSQSSKAPKPAPAEKFKMPDLVGVNLQEAQDELQSMGSFLMDQEDASGQGRWQLLDDNWYVCSQKPAAGKKVPLSAIVTLYVVKLDETCP